MERSIRLGLLCIMCQILRRNLILGELNSKCLEFFKTLFRLELDVSKIKWFTENHQQPGDGEEMPPTCMLQSLAEFLGVSCNSAIVIANVIGFACLAVVLVFVVALTKRRFVTFTNKKLIFL